MFTGIVETTGEVVKSEQGAPGMRLWVRSETLRDAAIGASVAVNGVCLTVAERDGDTCRFDLAPETVGRTTLRAPRERVNIERPLRLGDELGGHMVQGHVDGVGRVAEVGDDSDGRRLRIELPVTLMRFVAEKGSVTVDGVSLTVTDVERATFGVALVPHTLEVTTLGDLRGGDAVNIEVDVLAKYVERLVRPAGAEGEVAPEEPGYL